MIQSSTPPKYQWLQVLDQAESAAMQWEAWQVDDKHLLSLRRSNLPPQETKKSQEEYADDIKHLLKLSLPLFTLIQALSQRKQ